MSHNRFEAITAGIQKLVGYSSCRHRNLALHPLTPLTDLSPTESRGSGTHCRTATMPDSAIASFAVFIHACLLVHLPVTDGLEVVVPSASLALLGEDALLNCTFAPARYSAEDFVLHWIRLWPSAREGTIYSFYHNREQWDQVDVEFVNRTRLFHSSAAPGSCALLLTGVRTTDAGKYKAFVRTRLGIGHYRNAYTELQVAARYSQPLISLSTVCSQNKTALHYLTCTVSGGYPLAHIHWHNDLGEDRTAHSETTNVAAEDGLIQMSSQINISTHSNRTYTCSVSNPLLTPHHNISATLPVNRCVPLLNTGVMVTVATLSILLLLSLACVVRWLAFPKRATDQREQDASATTQELRTLRILDEPPSLHYTSWTVVKNISFYFLRTANYCSMAAV
ncbi:CD276 antigen-like isoform X2 [Carcharodon carcharias]|uniref:CD276 antigen-like isoform X2 n=1 Tax=Carcharodon carcharias TaxID=13397 RepID=UPI001B7ED8DB|nr:CD276 antigen-like isoform X2 [Carcharodon carcharias]